MKTLALAVMLAACLPASAQTPNIAPVYEGFETNDDGSFNLLFGYYNRDWEEELEKNRLAMYDFGCWGVPSFRLLDAGGEGATGTTAAMVAELAKHQGSLRSPNSRCARRLHGC